MGNYTHMQNKDGKTIKVTGVKKDGQMYFEGDDGTPYSVPKKMFLDSYNEGKIKIGNIDDKGNFVEYKLPNIGTVKKAAKLTFAPYGTMAKGDWDWKTAGQDALHFIGGDIINSAIDEFIPNKDTKMKTSWLDGVLGTGLAFAGYKALPSAAHRRVPVLPVSDDEKFLKADIRNLLTKGEAYGATHPNKRVSTQGAQDRLNRDVTNRVYKKNPIFNKKVPTPLDNEFVWNTDKRLTDEIVKESNALRASASGSDKTKVTNQKYEGSQQRGGTENIHTEIRGQQPDRKRDLSELFDGKNKEVAADALDTKKVYNNFEDILNDAERVQSGQEPSERDFTLALNELLGTAKGEADELLGGGAKEVANDALGIQKTINTEKNSNKGSQNSGTKDTKVEEHNSSSGDVNTNKIDKEQHYSLEPILEDVENHTITDTREDLKDLYKNNSKEAKRIKNAKSLNELNDIVTDVRHSKNDAEVDKWEQAMKDHIAAINGDVDAVVQAQVERGKKLNLLDDMKISGKKPKLESNITFTKIPRRGGTVADYVKSYGESQNPGIRYPAGIGIEVGGHAIPVLRNKDDESFNAGRPSGDEVFEEIRASMNKKPSVEYVDTSKRKK